MAALGWRCGGVDAGGNERVEVTVNEFMAGDPRPCAPNGARVITGYDVIGDVHGYADKLEGLLVKLGYSHRTGVWGHPERTAVFIGDLIDRGPQQRSTVDSGSCDG